MSRDVIDNLWNKHREKFLKTYLWVALFLLGVFFTLYHSWSEIVITPIDQEKPECISSGILWNNAGSDTSMRISTDWSWNIKTLGTFFNGPSEDIIVSNYYPNGTLKGFSIWGGSMKDRGYAMATDTEGNTYITGVTESFGLPEEELLLLKINCYGAVEWSKHFDLGGGNGQFGLGIDTYKNESIYVTGYFMDYVFMVGECPRFFIFKFDPSGSVIWNHFGDGPLGDGIGEDLLLDDSGDIIVTGYTPIDNAFIAKYNENGTRLWKTTWGISGRIEWGKSLVVNNATNLITCAGIVENEGIFLVQFNESGALLQSSIDSTHIIDDIEHANMKITKDDKENILVPWIETAQGSYVAKLKKYDISTLAPLWDITVPEINSHHGFGVAYNPNQQEILTLGMHYQDSMLMVIRDMEPFTGDPFTIENVVHVSIFT